jgi:hypothetical protein
MNGRATATSTSPHHSVQPDVDVTHPSGHHHQVTIALSVAVIVATGLAVLATMLIAN